MSRTRVVAAAVIAAATIVAAFAAAAVVLGFSTGKSATPLHGDAVWPGQGRPAPLLHLRNQAGQDLSLAAFHGHVVAVTFLDSHCKQACPVEAQQLAAVDRMLPAKERPEIVVISVNPADTPASVHRFVHKARWTGPWTWLMGTQAQLRPVWRRFAIEVLPPGSVVNGVKVNDIAHSTAMYLLDPNGNERTGYVAPFLPKLVAEDVRTLESS
jgi:cytochrome oxidase Cu insertion factor (SCO1/SenC/PrrC family)